MNKLVTAIALSIALPAVAYAQTAPTPAADADCSAKMKAQGKECCCKDMAKMGSSKHDMKPGMGAQGGHDMSGAKAPQTGTYQSL